MDKRQLLAEIEDIIRTAPTDPNWSLGDAATLEWVGRAEATFMQLGLGLSSAMTGAISRMNTYYAEAEILGRRDVNRLLQTARWKLRQETGGPTSLAIDAGMVFDYFQGVQKAIQAARADVMFVDPYLDGEVVERYLPSIVGGTNVRLLGRERIASLVAAAGPFAKQHGLSIEVRSASGFHDRFVFIDKKQCFQSGASFKDGARKAPTTLTEVTDAFSVLWSTYDGLWNTGKLEALM